MIIFVTGQSGIGKTWICDRLRGSFIYRSQVTNFLNVFDMDTMGHRVTAEVATALGNRKEDTWIIDLEELGRACLSAKNVVIAGCSHNLENVINVIADMADLLNLPYWLIFISPKDNLSIVQRALERTEKFYLSEEIKTDREKRYLQSAKDIESIIERSKTRGAKTDREWIVTTDSTLALYEVWDCLKVDCWYYCFDPKSINDKSALRLRTDDKY